MISSITKEADEDMLSNEFLFLKSGYKIRRINFGDILYIEGLKEYVKENTQHSIKPVLSLSSLKALETKLPPDKFIRIHHSICSESRKINTVDRSRIVFSKVYIPVGDHYKDRFQEFLERNFL
jgi:two-component system response regulator LytT